MHTPTFEHERELIAAGHLAIGVDEAGCGCLAGPVIAAAAYLPLDSRLGLIRDSKLLSFAQREHLFLQFAARGCQWAIGAASPEEIDAMNIRQATYLAMERAVRAFLQTVSLRGSQATEAIPATRTNGIATPRSGSARNDNQGVLFALVDAWTIPNLPIPQRGIVHGDRLVKSIAAASIIAKVTRDRMMDNLDAQYPVYGFRQHRGYATAAHRAAIIHFGSAPIHRRTFLKSFISGAAA
ncbi:MAG: ribonuclease HII [Candidatus Uhrbacteria bacterium]